MKYTDLASFVRENIQMKFLLWKYLNREIFVGGNYESFVREIYKIVKVWSKKNIQLVKL